MSLFHLPVLDVFPQVVADGSQGGVHLHTEVTPEAYWCFVNRGLLLNRNASSIVNSALLSPHSPLIGFTFTANSWVSKAGYFYSTIVWPEKMLQNKSDNPPSQTSPRPVPRLSVYWEVSFVPASRPSSGSRHCGQQCASPRRAAPETSAHSESTDATRTRFLPHPTGNPSSGPCCGRRCNA